MTRASDVMESTKGVQDQYFRVTDEVPTEVWYWAAIVSILASAVLFASNKRDWSLFVGQWPPTFLLFGVFHKLLHAR
jgi:hypothetical protein